MESDISEEITRYDKKGGSVGLTVIETGTYTRACGGNEEGKRGGRRRERTKKERIFGRKQRRKEGREEKGGEKRGKDEVV